MQLLKHPSDSAVDTTVTFSETVTNERLHCTKNEHTELCQEVLDPSPNTLTDVGLLAPQRRLDGSFEKL